MVAWVHWLPGFLDAGDLDEPDDRIAQIDEKPEWVMAQHDTRHDDTGREACFAAAHSLPAGSRRSRRARHSSESGSLTSPMMP